MNDLAYQLFKEIEIDLQDKLVNPLQPSSAPGDTKAEMIAISPCEIIIHCEPVRDNGLT